MILATSKKSTPTIPTGTLVLLAFASAFFARLLSNAGFPDIINFAHFLVVPAVCIYALVRVRLRDRVQLKAVQSVLWGLLVMLGIMLASALLNGAGVINVLLSFLILMEPFIMLLAIVVLPLSSSRCRFIGNWLIWFGLFHILLAYIQRYILRYDLKRTGLVSWDNIQGVFFLSPGAPPVAVGVSIITGLYILIFQKKWPLWVRVIIFCASWWHLVMAEAKQLILVFGLAWALLALTKAYIDVGKALLYFCAIVLLIYPLYWCLANLEIFSTFHIWFERTELFTWDGDATNLKFTAFRIVPEFYTSVLNWFLGLGPGHTVGRLGGGMLEKYWNQLEVLGATTHPASHAVFHESSFNWLSGGSNLLKPDFSWAGIWGDFGILGVCGYLLAWWLVKRTICQDDFSNFLVLGVIPLGMTQAMLEQPGYMLFMTVIVGLRWHEHYLRLK